MSQRNVENSVVMRAIESLRMRQLDNGLTFFGGHPLVAEDKETITTVRVWSEYVRVCNPDSPQQSMVFRVLTRDGYDTLLQDRPVGFAPRVRLDNRSNLEREMESGLYPSSTLLQSYKDLLRAEIDMVLTPVREGSLGSSRPMYQDPDESERNIGPFTTAETKYNPKVWDLEEEVRIGTAIFEELADIGSDLQMTLEDITNIYQGFAAPIIEAIGADPANLYDHQAVPAFDDDQPADLTFFDPRPQEYRVNLGLVEQKVEQLIAYLYPTQSGMLYIRLMRVWNETGDKFAVVRVVQTKPTLQQIDGLRFDSNCTDGVHSLDCHCDCGAQLWWSLKQGLVANQNTVVIELEDDEGKGHGGPAKNAIHRVMRESNAGLPISEWIGNPVAAAAFYTALDLPHDVRTFNAGQAVCKALGITHVTTLLSGNTDKMHAATQAGITFERAESVILPPGQNSIEAIIALAEKTEGVVIGTTGMSVTYAH